jgi:hypothetical protein
VIFNHNETLVLPKEFCVAAIPTEDTEACYTADDGKIL